MYGCWQGCDVWQVAGPTIPRVGPTIHQAAAGGRLKKSVIWQIICCLTNRTICEMTNLISTRIAHSTNSALIFLMKIVCIKVSWASSWDYGTYHTGDQRRLRQACPSTQSRQSRCCLHTWSMEVDEGSDKNQTSSPTGWLLMRVWRMSLQRTKSTIIWWHGSI